MHLFVYLEENRVAVGELPTIEGTFSCAVPRMHPTYAKGVFSGTDFGYKSEAATNTHIDGIAYGYRIKFGDNQYHNNTAPVVACFCWKRTA